MRLHQHALVLAAGALCLQAAPCQGPESTQVFSALTGVSMTVFAEDGPAGYPC